MPSTQLAYILLQQQRPDLAEQEARRQLQQEPTDAETYALLAIALFQLQRPAEAETAARRALTLDPQLAQAHYVLGMSLLEQRQPREARLALLEAIGLIPFEPAYHAALGWSYFVEAQWGRALAAAKAGMRLDPLHVGCCNLRLRVLSQSKQTEPEFVAAQEAALSVAPNSELTHTNVGFSYLDGGDFRRARHHLEEALRLNPTSKLAYDGLRQAHLSRFWLYRAATWLGRIVARGLAPWLFRHPLRGLVSRVLYLGLVGLSGCLLYTFSDLDAWVSFIAGGALLWGIVLLFPLGRLCLLTLLRLDPRARLLLNPLELVFSNLLIGVAVAALVLTGAVLLPTNGLTALPLMLFGLVVPLGGSKVLPAGAYRRASYWSAGAFAVLGVYATYVAAVSQSSTWEMVLGYLLLLYLLVFSVGDWPE
jgi:Flp pilus assembly protein TadD